MQALVEHKVSIIAVQKLIKFLLCFWVGNSKILNIGYSAAGEIFVRMMKSMVKHNKNHEAAK